MKQLDFFNLTQNNNSQKTNVKTTTWLLHIDGAARNNPGPAGAGVYVLKNNEVFTERGFFLGIKTNNQAEYLALLLGLLIIKQVFKPDDHVHILSDSELLVRQINGIYKVKNSDLKPLFTLARTMLNQLKGSISHVLRSENIHADRMANKGIDKKEPVPQEFLNMLSSYEISI